MRFFTARSARFPRYFACAAALTVVAVSSPAGAVKLKVADDTFINVRLLLQPWIELKNDPTVTATNPNLTDFTNDYFLRRTRVLFGGQVTKWVSFFMETDMPNWGRRGNWSVISSAKDATTGAMTSVNEVTGFFVQDAYVSIDLHESFHVAAGMLMLPFVHFSRQSAANLHTLDYHSTLLRYPTSGDKVWRSTGVEVRGLLLKKKIDYRIAMTNGVADKTQMVAATYDSAGVQITPAVMSNTNDAPRVTGRVAYNFFDAEEGFFLGGTYLGKKKILSVGFAFDAQPGVFGSSLDGAKRPYYAIGGDVFLDYPLRSNLRLSGQVDVVYYGGEDNPKRGFGMAMDIGFAIGKFEPLIGFDYFKGPDASELEDQYLGIHPAFNYWLAGHNANIKLDLGIVKREKVTMDQATLVATIQMQLFF